MIKIYLPNTENYTGGPKTFLMNLKKYIDSNPEIEIVDIDLNSNVILFPVEYPKGRLSELKDKNIKIIQRLDGVFYPSKHTAQQVEFNQSIKYIYDNFADYIIFQSDYGKRQCFEMLGPKSSNKYSIIINGADKELFQPTKKELDTSCIRFVTTGNFRNEDMLSPLIQALDLLENKYKFEFTIIGKVTNEKLKPLLKRGFVKHFKNIDHSSMIDYLAKSDIFLYSFINPVCPNSVIEAISIGLPVVGLNSGSMPELLSFNTNLLAEVSSDLFQLDSDINPERLALKIEELILNFDEYKNNSLNNAHLYSMEECAKEYIKVIKKVVTK